MEIWYYSIGPSKSARLEIPVLKYVVRSVDMWSHSSVCVMWVVFWSQTVTLGLKLYTNLSKKTKCTLLFGALHVHLYLPLWYVQLHSLVFSIPRLQTAGCGLLAMYPGSFSLNARERAPGNKASRLQTTDYELHILQSVLWWDTLSLCTWYSGFAFLLKMIGKANNSSNK